MLVLSRKLGEKIIVGGNPGAPGCDIVITLVEINGAKVRLGFDAPDGVRILRLEIAGQPPKPTNREVAIESAN